MCNFNLGDDLQKVENIFKTSKNPKIKERAQVLLLRHKGKILKDIADIVMLTDRMVRILIRKYKNQGLDEYLHLHYSERHCGSKLDEYKDTILKELTERPASSLREIKNMLYEKTGIVFNKTTIFRFLKKMK